jgi:cell fate (sporulation/competence/biofilm development) regulator YlbF (YheA/YmcA/DUF963 family)
MEDKIFGCECRDYKCADWVSIEEYNRVVKENEQLLEYIRNKKHLQSLIRFCQNVKSS